MSDDVVGCRDEQRGRSRSAVNRRPMYLGVHEASGGVMTGLRLDQLVTAKRSVIIARCRNHTSVPAR
jgi:hypothetical protein